MHCPRCGQQQVSDQVKFCSRCGFLLELIPEILANGGTLPQLAKLYEDKKLLTRKNIFKFGVIWMIVMWFVIVPLGAIADLDVIFISASILGFAGILLSILIGFMFFDKESKFSKTSSFRSDVIPQNLSGNVAGQSALPPQQSIPVDSYVPPSKPGSWHTTNDLTAPGSVTEQTTKLLEKEDS